MIVGVTAEQICTWPTNEGGWHVSPDTYDWVKIGDHARIGDWVKIGNYAKIGNCAEIGGQERIGDWVEIGNYAKIGNCAEIGNCAKIGDYAEIGNCAKIGDHARIGDWVKIGNYAKIGNCAEIGGQEHVLHAHVLKYIANAYRVADGSLILRYGCEAHPFAEWTPDAIVEMSKKHEPACAAEYVDALTALTILVRSIFGDV